MTDPTVPEFTPTLVSKLKRRAKARTSADPLEATIEARVCSYAKERSVDHRKYVTPNYASSPDRVFYPGHGLAFFIEFKRKGRVATPKQEREHARLRNRGFDVYVVDNVEDGMRVIDFWVTHTKSLYGSVPELPSA